jgi:hypothetical protein
MIHDSPKIREMYGRIEMAAVTRFGQLAPRIKKNDRRRASKKPTKAFELALATTATTFKFNGLP